MGDLHCFPYYHPGQMTQCSCLNISSSARLISLKFLYQQLLSQYYLPMCAKLWDLKIWWYKWCSQSTLFHSWMSTPRKLSRARMTRIQAKNRATRHSFSHSTTLPAAPKLPDVGIMLIRLKDPDFGHPLSPCGWSE